MARLIQALARFNVPLWALADCMPAFAVCGRLVLDFFTLRAWSVPLCIRPVRAVHGCRNSATIVHVSASRPEQFIWKGNFSP